MKRTLLGILLVLFAGAVCADELVNLKYLQNQQDANIVYRWQLAEINVEKSGREVKILLNYPFIMYKDKVVKIDTPPFTEGGEIYISEYTYSKIAEIFETGGIKHADAPEEKKKEEAKKEKVPEKKEQVKEQVKEAKKEEKHEGKKEESKQVKREEKKEEKEIPQPVKKKGPKVIVIDPGHGGSDPGAVGPNGVQEKDIVLGIALRVKYNLERKGLTVYITRDSDKFISLKKRAMFANNNNADLFVSIHCNASPDRRAKGTRNYIYSRIASSKEAAEAAKLENKKVSMFEFLLNDLKKSAFEYLSIEAAGSVQHCLVKELRLKWTPTERAPFYVLANTNMPSILVETAFISNPKEEKLLNTSSFRVKVADGITDGIMEYVEKIK